MAYGRLVRRLSRRAQDTLADASAYAAENLTAARTMQAFTHEQAVSDRFASGVEHAFEAARRRMSARAGLTAIAIFLVFASVVGVLWYGAQEVMAGAISAGRLGQFVLYAIFAGSAMGALSEIWGEVQQTAGAAERLSELLAVEPEIVSPATPMALPPGRGEIAFQNVTFSYPTRVERTALHDISFSVGAGERVAIVGPSRRGKEHAFCSSFEVL